VTSQAVAILLTDQQCCKGHAQGARHGCCASGVGYCMGVSRAKLIGVFAVTSQAVVILLTEQQCCKGNAQGAGHGCCASGVGYCRGA